MTNRGVLQSSLCEGAQRPRQSHVLLVEQGVATPCSVKIATTPERRFAMTNEDCDTVSFAGMTILLVLCSYAKLSQSHALLVEQGVATPCSVKIAITPERRFAMTNEDCDTVSFAGMTILLVLCLS